MKSRSLVFFTAVTAVVVALMYRYLTTYEYVIGRSEAGLLRGVNTSTWRGTSYFSFKGIPYARAPVKELRFKATVEAEPWSGVRDAVYHGSVCPHRDLVFGYLRGDEDCLFLNVYTPSMNDSKLPVMVWIHGGGFILGSANEEMYGPDLFIDEGVVLVTLNYRLGALGFLNTEDGVIPGNAGLKDQNLALRWVQRNIANFGGDPKKVTIFGESAGAASVNFHILSPKSKGLFVRAISQSGSPFNSWAQTNRCHEFAQKLAKHLGLENPATGGEFLQHLQSVSYDKIVYGQEEIKSSEEHPHVSPYLFLPSVEINVDPAEAFITNSSLDLLKSGNYTKVPHIIGYNSDEGLVLVKEYSTQEGREDAIRNPDKFVPLSLNFEPEKKKEVAESLRNFYFPEKTITDDNVQNLINMYTDLVFASPINRAVHLYLESSDQPIYHYIFSYHGGFNLMRLFFNIKEPGTAHADELAYMFFFKSIWFWKPAAGSKDEFVGKTLVRLWANFAKYGSI